MRRRGATKAPWLLCGLLIGAVSGLPAGAATIRLPDTGGAVGAATSVPILVDDAAGFLGVDLSIAYDPAVAVAGSVSITSLSTGDVLTVNLTSPGVIRISLYGSTPLGGAGALLD